MLVRFIRGRTCISASSELVDLFSKTGLPVVGVCPVEMEEVSNYGVVDISNQMVRGIVEKPDMKSAPSEYVLCGRYIFPENTKKILEMYPVSEFGELQSIEILNHLIENGGLQAVKLEHVSMYDSGNPLVLVKITDRSRITTRRFRRCPEEMDGRKDD